jgi:hypothetical protein
MKPTPVKPTQKKIFLSHSSKDEILVDKLTDLLTTGCDVSANDILVTTLPGKGIPAGFSNYIEYLKEQIQEPALVVLLLSENYFSSQFCLCELGATWALSLPNFPLVVPPLKKSEVKATLAVTQLGGISDSEYLDELRDAVRQHLGAELPTATWSTKRDVFLRTMPKIFKKIPRPDHIPRSELIEAESKYKAALQEIEDRDGEINVLKEKIGDLEECKDAAEVRKVQRKYSSTDQEFERLCKEAKRALGSLDRATREALFSSIRGERYNPDDRDDQQDARHAEEIDEISIDERGCEPNSSHPRVSKAEDRINELGRFLDKLNDLEFSERFEDQHQFTASIRNREFWDKFL